MPHRPFHEWPTPGCHVPAVSAWNQHATVGGEVVSSPFRARYARSRPADTLPGAADRRAKPGDIQQGVDRLLPVGTSRNHAKSRVLRIPFVAAPHPHMSLTGSWMSESTTTSFREMSYDRSCLDVHFLTRLITTTIPEFRFRFVVGRPRSCFRAGVDGQLDDMSDESSHGDPIWSVDAVPGYG